MRINKLLSFWIVPFVLLTGVLSPVSAQESEQSISVDEDAMFTEDIDAAAPIDEDVFLNPFDDTVGEEEAAAESGNAETAPGSDDYDSLFQEGMIEEIDKETQNKAPEEDLLKSEILRWGGRFTGNATTDSLWEKYHEDFKLGEPTSASISVEANADLYFDARPLKDFRVFGKLKIEAGQAADISVLPEEGVNVRPTTDAEGNTTLTV
ncbi:MAG: hypothetical protein E4H36_15420, partial [Spirochaetales bacterium]